MFISLKKVYILLILLMVIFPLSPMAYENLLNNPSFETVGPSGSPTSFTGIMGGCPGCRTNSAALDWDVYNNRSGITTTDLLPSTFLGGGVSMIHVTTDDAYNGLYQTFLPTDTGPEDVLSSVWIYVLHGAVGIGTGNDGNTILDTLTSTTGTWEFVQAHNGISPANEFIIYAASNGGAEFYVDNAVSAVPEPATMLLLGSGLLGLCGTRKKFKK